MKGFSLEDLDFEELVSLMGKQISEDQLLSLITLYLNTKYGYIDNFVNGKITLLSEIVDILLKAKILSKIIDEFDIINVSDCGKDFSVCGRGKILI